MAKRAAKRNQYHHGDLRALLIEASAAELAKSDADSLSLRKIAELIGVSHNAPYMHFRDKEALLESIAESGFIALRRALDDVLAHNSELAWQEKFHKGCLCYVEFCIANKGYVAAMFRKYDFARFPDLRSVSTQSIEPLYEVLEQGQSAGLVRPANVQQMASAVWAMLHGISQLLAFRDDIPMVMGESKTDRLVHNLVEQLLIGLQTHDKLTNP